MNCIRIGICVAICCLISMATGCTTNTCTRTFSLSMNEAYEALEDGRPQDAAERLQKAEAIAANCSCDISVLERVKVETFLQLGETVEAYDQAKHLLEADPDNPHANELYGKVCLVEGEFIKAETHFNTAQQNYNIEADIARAKDLLSLARYFLAYQDANPTLAEQYMREIEDSALAHSLDKAQKELSVTRIN